MKVIDVQDCEVVYAFLSLSTTPTLLDEVGLEHEERMRARRFHRPADRRRFVLAHVALRVFLARCLEVDPMTVRYVKGMNGKPQLAPGLPPLEFNMSHSGDLGLLAVTRDRSLGVDVERLREAPDALEIAAEHFAATEAGTLRSLPPMLRDAAFFRCWTRKEALIKAEGEGLTRALNSFEVDLSPGSTAALKHFAGRSGHEVGWSLRELPSPPGYVAAGAVAASAGASTQWRELPFGTP